MDTKKIDYTDLIDFDCKNQTAKLLENYFHRMRDEEYDSVVTVEKEIYSKPFSEYIEYINTRQRNRYRPTTARKQKNRISTCRTLHRSNSFRIS